MASLRKYRISSESEGELSIAMLRALVCSSTALAAELARGTRSDVFLCRDRHSDFMCWYTCCLVVRNALAEAFKVVVCLLHEEHIKWHPRVQAHKLVKHITSVVPNSWGELLLMDSEAGVIYMMTRHVPAILVAVAGARLKPGDADLGTVSAKAARFRQPQHFAMLVIEAGKQEHCYFTDVGNKKIRLLKNVHSIEASHTVTTIVIRGQQFEPYALSLVSKSNMLLAVSEDHRRRVVLVNIDADFVHGALISEVQWLNLLSPNSLASLDDVLYISNQSNVLSVKLRVQDWAQGQPQLEALHNEHKLVDAQGLAVERAYSDNLLDHLLYVSDAALNQIVIFRVGGITSSQAVNLLAVSTMGTGAAATLSGPISAAAFHEPLGLAVACGVLYVACYGGGCGAVVAVSRTTFAVKLLEALSNLYDAGGFVPPGASEARRAARHMPLSSALDMFEHSIRFLSQTCEARSRRLAGHKGLKGPDGSFYHHSIKGGEITLESCRKIQRDLAAAGVSHPENITLHSMVDEGPVETGFGHWVLKSQTDVPTKQMWARQQPKMQRHTIMKSGRTPWSQHTGRLSSTYASSRVSSIPADVMMAHAEKAFKAQHPRLFGYVRFVDRTAGGKMRLALERARAKRFTRIAEAQRVGAVRSFFKGKGQFGPTVLEPVLPPNTDSPTPPRNYPSYREHVRAVLRSQGGVVEAREELLSRETHKYLGGDVVFLLAGTEDDYWLDRKGGATGSLDEDALWWPVQLIRPVKTSQTGSQCELHAFWLEKEAQDTEAAEEAENSCWALLTGGHTKLRMKHLLIDPESGQPFLLTSDMLSSNWSTSQQMVFVFSADYVARLDLAAEAAHGAASEVSDGGRDIQNSEPGSDSDDENTAASGTHAEKEAATTKDNLRHASLREYFETSAGPSRHPVESNDRQASIARLHQIQERLSQYRAEWMEENPNAGEISTGDWPLSLRRQLKEHQRLDRSIRESFG